MRAQGGLALDAALELLDATTLPRVTGRVTELVGLVLRATAPGARTGELVVVERSRGQGAPLLAEVVGFHGDQVTLLPLGTAAGVGPDSAVRPTGRPLSVRAGLPLLGRVLDGLGQPIDGQGPLEDGAAAARLEWWPVERASPPPLSRRRVTEPIATGVRAIDALLTLGEGQRVGIFAGPGLGKTTLLGQVARHSQAEIIVVGLVGERGREVRDFFATQLDDASRRRTVLVAATADAPPLLRLKSALVATAVAEYFRAAGRQVLLIIDSLTRVARAQREVGLAAGEPPARQGYPPSVFALLPRLIERSGQGERGAITALYAVLTGSDEADDPIAEEARALLDGHIVLSEERAARGQWPAIDPLRSLSRVMNELVDPAQRRAAARVRATLAIYERQRELVALGAYQVGRDPEADEALRRIRAIESFLYAEEAAPLDLARSRQALLQLFTD